MHPSSPPLLLSLKTNTKRGEYMEEMASLWSHQEISDELKLKIHYTALELEAVKAKAHEEMSKNSESLKQLLHLLKLVCQERDEARDQLQQLLNKIMPIRNNSMTLDRQFVIDQVNQHHQYPLVAPAKANSSIAESNSLSDAYNHCSSPVNSLEFSNINNKTSFVQHHQMLPDAFDTIHSVSKMDRTTLMMENMIKGKALPQKGNLLRAVMEAGPLLETLLASNPLSNWGKLLSPPRFVGSGGQNQITMMTKQSQQISEMSYGISDQMIGGDGGSFLSFNDVNSSNQWRMTTNCPMASNFGLVEKRQRFR